jgi:hypothetical protein
MVLQPQVLVAVDRLQVGGDCGGQRGRVGGVPSLGQPFGQDPGHCRGNVGVEVVRFDQRADLADDVSWVCFRHTVKKNRRLTERQEL